MSTFRYTALMPDGKKTQRIIEADTDDYARQMLRDRGYAPLQVELADNANSKMAKSRLSRGRHALGRRHLNRFTEQLGNLLHAGIPMSNALSFIAQRFPDRKQSIVQSIRGKVLDGESFTTSISSYPETFDALYIASAEAGERTGALDKVLINLAELQQQNHDNVQRVKASLIYPCILLFASAAVVSLLMIKVMPGFAELFEQNNQHLPPMTLLVLGTFNFLKKNAIALFVSLLLLVILFRSLAESLKLKAMIDRTILRVPGVSALTRYNAAETTIRTVHVLTSGGVQLVDALKISIAAVANGELQRKLSQSVQLIEDGYSFSGAVSKTASMPTIVVQLLAAGEMTGDLDTALKKTAQLLNKETQANLSMIITLFEPIILTAVSCVIFIIVLALMEPILQLNSFV